MESKHIAWLGLSACAVAAVFLALAPQAEDRKLPVYDAPSSSLPFTAEELAARPRPAIPANSPATWLIDKDYPQEAILGGITGTLSFRLIIDPFGEVVECSIPKTSGYRNFDMRACAAISTRARFHPALNADGDPIEGSYLATVQFEMPE